MSYFFSQSKSIREPAVIQQIIPHETQKQKDLPSLSLGTDKVQSCLEASLQEAQKPHNRPIGSNLDKKYSCPSGYLINYLKCENSILWCEPPKAPKDHLFALNYNTALDDVPEHLFYVLETLDNDMYKVNPVSDLKTSGVLDYVFKENLDKYLATPLELKKINEDHKEIHLPNSTIHLINTNIYLTQKGQETKELLFTLPSSGFTKMSHAVVDPNHEKVLFFYQTVENNYRINPSFIPTNFILVLVDTVSGKVEPVRLLDIEEIPRIVRGNNLENVYWANDGRVYLDLRLIAPSPAGRNREMHAYLEPNNNWNLVSLKRIIYPLDIVYAIKYGGDVSDYDFGIDDSWSISPDYTMAFNVTFNNSEKHIIGWRGVFNEYVNNQILFFNTHNGQQEIILENNKKHYQEIGWMQNSEFFLVEEYDMNTSQYDLERAYGEEKGDENTYRVIGGSPVNLFKFSRILAYKTSTKKWCAFDTHKEVLPWIWGGAGVCNTL